MTSQAENGAKGESDKKSFRRRQYLVDRKRQLATTLRVAGLVLVLLVILNGMLAWQNFSATQAATITNPEVGEKMRAVDMRNIAITAGISLIILAMVVMRSIMLTHRTAGAVYKISQCMEQVGEFNFDVNLRLRNDDNLKALEDPFNKMAGTLRRRALDDYQAMKKLADEIEDHGSPVDAEMLRRIADSTARMAK
jgi:nitrogen fixation/metabolism regulation signal transduction histidine kinase